MELNGTLGWLVGRGLALLVGVIVLLVVYRIGTSAIHRVVPAAIGAQVYGGCAFQASSAPSPGSVCLGRAPGSAV